MHLIKLLLLTSLLLAGIKLFSQTERQSFIVKINGKEYKLQEDEEVTIDSVFNKLRISVSASPYKIFEAEAISFQYPKNMASNFQKNLGVDTWTLNGNDFVIMYFEFASYVKPEDMVKSMVKKFGEKNCSVSVITKKLGEKTLTGKRINISMAGQKLNMDLFEINPAEEKSRLIVFQDSVSDFSNSSEEAKSTLKIIDNTIIYK